MIWLIIIFVILFILTWILFIPMIIKVDTDAEDYTLRMPGLFKARIVNEENEIYMKVRVLFISFKVRPSNFKGKKPTEKGEKQKSGSLSIKYLAMAAMDIYKSFRLKYLYLNIDTENVVLNSALIPVLMTLDNQRVFLNVNFMEKNTIQFDLRNRLANFIWTGIKYKYRTIVKP